MPPTAFCLSDAEVAAYIEGRVDAGRREAVRGHLDRCDDCRARVHRRAVSFFQESTLAGVEESPGAPSLERGSSLGRYVLLSAVGSGGMGVVYAAYDPELDRKLAIKLLRPDLTAGSVGRRREQLLTEAQAMARLNHPGVVAVHDVGTVGDQIFVAMEFVDGGTLRQFIDTNPPWPAVLATFIEAGRGLAAAHAAGIVHRDFKPENVLVGADGRVRVTDFGLALPSGSGATGKLAGTPAYMAPEQMVGGATDVRTDVFSFCAALYEGLYAVRPFAGTTLTDLREAVERGDFATPPPKAKVPAWIRRVVLRGLAADRAARWQTMSELLEALDVRHDPRRRARRVGAIAIAVLCVALAALSTARVVSRGRTLCRVPDGEPAGAWDPARRQQTSASIARAAGDVMAQRVTRAVDDRVTAWRAMWTEACEATRVRGNQSSELLDLRMACLDERRRELGALTNLLATADVDTAERALSAVAGLSSLDGCADADALRQLQKPPRDPKQRQQNDALVAEVQKAFALHLTGHWREALDIARAVDRDAAATGYAPLQAQAAHLVGVLEAEGGDYAGAAAALQRGAVFAIAGGDDGMLVYCWTDLIFVVGHQQRRIPEGKLWADYARSVIERHGGNESMELGRLSQLGLVLSDDGDPQAISILERVVALTEKIDGPDANDTAIAIVSLANELALRKEVSRAEPLHARAERIFERNLGRGHIDTLRAISNHGFDLIQLGRAAEAEPILAKNTADTEAILGRDNPSTATARINWGEALELLGRHVEARKAEQDAVTDLARIAGADHPVLIEPLTWEAIAAQALGDGKDARVLLARALAIGEAAKVPERDLEKTREAIAKLR